MSMAAGEKYQGEQANLDLTSELKDGQVIFTIGSEVQEMIGAQFNIVYDKTRLSLDDVIFDTGNTMTNFSNHIEEEGKINIGSFDQRKTRRDPRDNAYESFTRGTDDVQEEDNYPEYGRGQCRGLGPRSLLCESGDLEMERERDVDTEIGRAHV